MSFDSFLKIYSPGIPAGEFRYSPLYGESPPACPVGTSKYFGVAWCKERGYWMAWFGKPCHCSSITCGTATHIFKYFSNEHGAAQWRDEAILRSGRISPREDQVKAHPDLCCLNFGLITIPPVPLGPRVVIAMVLSGRFRPIRRWPWTKDRGDKGLRVGGHVSWEVLWPAAGGGWSLFPKDGATIVQLVGEPFHYETLDQWIKSHPGRDPSGYDPKAWQRIQIKF